MLHRKGVYSFIRKGRRRKADGRRGSRGGQGKVVRQTDDLITNL